MPHISGARALVCRNTIDALRTYSDAYFGTPNLGDNPVALIVGCALIVGQSEGRLMSATDVSEYLGVPRATVVRILHGFARRGVLGTVRDGRRIQYYVVEANSRSVEIKVSRMVARTLNVCNQLSKMDGTKLARN